MAGRPAIDRRRSHADLLGTHIVAVNRVPMASVVAALAPIIPADNLRQAAEKAVAAASGRS